MLLERTGGFAGLRLTATIDTESLPQEEARELVDMVYAAGFFDLPAVIAAPAAGADRFNYRLTVKDESREHTVEVGESAASGALGTLLHRLNALARSAQRSRYESR